MATVNPKFGYLESYDFELRYEENKYLNDMDINKAAYLNKFSLMKEKSLDMWAESKILLIGDDSYRRVVANALPTMPNITSVFEQNCSLERVIQLVNENVESSYDFVFIFGFECEFVDHVKGARILREMETEDLNLLVKRMSSCREQWLQKFSMVNFLWILPYPENFVDNITGQANTKSIRSFINDMKKLIARVDKFYTLCQNSKSCVTERFRVVPLQNILAPGEKLTLYKTAPTSDYIRFIHRAKISFKLNPCYFWKMMFKYCFEIWNTCENSVQIVTGGSKIQRAIINYDNIQLHSKSKFLDISQQNWNSAQILMLKSALVPDLHHCKNSSFPLIYYEEWSKLSELKEKQLYLKSPNLLLVSPFDWILDACHKEDFDPEIILPQMLRDIKSLNTRWTMENPQLKVFWLLPYPRQHDKFKISEEDENNKDYTIEDYMSMLEFHTIKKIIANWTEVIPEVVMISLLDVMLSEYQQLSFINGSGKLLWKEYYITSKETGSIPLPAFTYRICLVIQRIYLALLSDPDYSLKINRSYQSRIQRQCISEEDMKHPQYENVLQKYFDKKDKVRDMGISRKLHNPPEEWAYIWHSKVKNLSSSVQPGKKTDADFWCSFGDYYFLRRGPSRIKKLGVVKNFGDWKAVAKPITNGTHGVNYEKNKRKKENAKKNKMIKNKIEQGQGKMGLDMNNSGMTPVLTNFGGMEPVFTNFGGMEQISTNFGKIEHVSTNFGGMEPVSINFGEIIPGPSKTITDFNCSLSIYNESDKNMPTINPLLCGDSSGIKVDMAAVATRGCKRGTIVKFVSEILKNIKQNFSEGDLRDGVELVLLKHKQMDEIELLAKKSSNASSSSNNLNAYGGGMTAPSDSIFSRINRKVGNSSSSDNYQSNASMPKKRMSLFSSSIYEDEGDLNNAPNKKMRRIQAAYDGTMRASSMFNSGIPLNDGLNQNSRYDFQSNIDNSSPSPSPPPFDSYGRSCR